MCIEAARLSSSIALDLSERCWEEQLGTERDVHLERWELEDGAFADYYCRGSDLVDRGQASSHYVAAPVLLHLGTP